MVKIEWFRFYLFTKAGAYVCTHFLCLDEYPKATPFMNILTILSIHYAFSITKACMIGPFSSTKGLEFYP